MRLSFLFFHMLFVVALVFCCFICVAVLPEALSEQACSYNTSLAPSKGISAFDETRVDHATRFSFLFFSNVVRCCSSFLLLYLRCRLARSPFAATLFVEHLLGSFKRNQGVRRNMRRSRNAFLFF